MNYRIYGSLIGNRRHEENYSFKLIFKGAVKVKKAICFILSAVITGIGFEYLYLPLIFGGIAGMLCTTVWVCMELWVCM